MVKEFLAVLLVPVVQIQLAVVPESYWAGAFIIQADLGWVQNTTNTESATTPTVISTSTIYEFSSQINGVSTVMMRCQIQRSVHPSAEDAARWRGNIGASSALSERLAEDDAETERQRPGIESVDVWRDQSERDLLIYVRSVWANGQGGAHARQKIFVNFYRENRLYGLEKTCWTATPVRHSIALTYLRDMWTGVTVRFFAS